MTPTPSHEKAAAEIVGSLVLISIFVLAFAILAMVLLSQPAPQKIPAVAISITNQSKIIRITHESGDPVPMSEVKVLVDEVPLTFTCNDCGDSWSIGETLTIDYSDHLNFPNKVDIVFLGSGTAQQLLSSIYLGTMTPTQTPVIIPTSPTPVTTATTPPVGAPVASFTGTPTSGFAPLTVVFTDTSTGTPTGWRWTFGDIGAGNTSTLRNPSHTYTVPGTYSVNLTVSNAGGSNSLVQSNYIIVSYAAPTVINITPNSGYNDTSVSITNLAGTGFITGATVRLNITGKPDIPATGVTVVSSTQITCTFALNGVPAGARNVVVTNPDGKSGMFANGFTVIKALPAPTVTSRSNATLYRGWPGYELIGGTNFVNGAQSVINTTTGDSIPSTSCDVRSSTQMYCSYDLLEETVSTAYRVAVINPDGKSGLMTTNLVSVSSPAPTITSSTPSTGAQAATVIITRLLGTNFQPDAIVVYSLGATSIPLQNIDIVLSTNITGTLVIPSDATVGSYSVTVTNTDLKSVTRASTFTVTSNAPTVTARSNATIYRGWMGYELITGTRFVSGAQSVINTTTGNSIPSTFCDVRSSTQIYCSYDLYEETVSTSYRVAVINPDGKSGLMTTNLVSVSSPAPTIPNTPAFSPSTGARGTNGVVVTAPGTYLQPGMVVVLTSANNPVTTINALSVNVISPTQVIFTFNIPAGATTGSYTARYTNTDGKTVTRTARFTVT
jgi:PKD repeat protein